MKDCEKCKEQTWILICELPTEEYPHETWVCPDCYLLDQGEKAFNAALRQAGITLDHDYLH